MSYDSGSMQKVEPDNGAGENEGEIGPDDSVSVVNRKSDSSRLKQNTADSEVSIKTTVSALLYRTQQKEIELVAKAAAQREKNKLEERKRKIQAELELNEVEEELRRVRLLKAMEEEKAKIEIEQQEIDMHAELQAAKAVSKLLQHHEERTGASTEISSKIAPEVEESIRVNSSTYPKPDTDVTNMVHPTTSAKLNPEAQVFINSQKREAEGRYTQEKSKVSNSESEYDKHHYEEKWDEGQEEMKRKGYAEACLPLFYPDKVPQPNDRNDCDNVTMATLLTKIVDHQRESALPSPDIDSFDGNDILEFTPFMRNFQHIVEDKTQNPARRLELLLRFTKGEAHDLIRECSSIEPPSKGYQRAKWLLRRDYGQLQVLAAAYQSKAESWERIAAGDKVSLRKFSIFLVNCCNMKYGNPEMDSMNGYDFLKVLAQKLPVAMQQQWIRKVGYFREIEMRSPTLEDFESFVGQLSRNENDPRVAGLGYQHKRSEWKTVPSKKRAFAATVYDKGSKQTTNFTDGKPPKVNKAGVSPCLYCGKENNHTLLNCRKFGNLTLKEKSDVCIKKGFCFGCLNPGHLKRNCPNPEWAKCEICNKAHVTVLHDPAREKKSRNQAETQGTPTITTGRVGIYKTKPTSKGRKENTGTLMAILPVLVKPKASNKCVATYAFIDNGCGAVFIDDVLQRTLRLRTRKTKIHLKTLNLEEVLPMDVLLDDLQVGNIDGSTFIDLPSVYVKDSIPATMADAPSQSDLDSWNHLRNIRLPAVDGPCSIPHVTLMIGSNVPGVSMPLEISSGKVGDPYAIRSPMGWLVYGLEGKLTERPELNVNFCRVGSGTVQSGTDHLEQQLQNYINMDFTERLSDQKRALSTEDKTFMNVMEESVTKVDGHYETALPLRDKSVQMPNNKVQAQQFALRLRRKLEGNEKLAIEYTEFMNTLEKKGYSEKIPLKELDRDDGKVWYVPHHSVYHPKKPDKIGVVFNCPVRYEEMSLNEQLLPGPDLTNHMYGVLMRWRKENVAFMADIEAMFYQVKIRKSDCDLLRYLWWPGGDFNDKPKEHRMLVHLFGAVSSPSCANFAMKRTAIDNEDKFGKEVIASIHNDFYVDDFLKSVATEEEGIQLCHDLKKAMADGGFKLTKWVSNSRKLLESIPKEDRAKEVKNLNLENDKLPKERALGVHWCVEKDQLEFRVKVVNKKPTRRNILSAVSAVYDPIGCVTPFLLNAKKILQALCRLKIDWDSDIPDDQRREWENWLKELPSLENLKLRRCFKPGNFGTVVNTQLHHFSDASQDGYGTATYLRFTNDRDEIHCAFVTGKARVAPLKPHTIVKMELTAATSAVRQDNMLKEELSLPIDETVFWTDSQTVLKYISSEKARHPVFVANRVAVIHDGSDVHQWRYVPSKLNPADHASRGLSADELISKEDWLKGPEFLSQTEDLWPKQNKCHDIQNIKSDHQDCEGEVTVSAVNIQRKNCKSPTDNLIDYFSEWNKLKRSVAWWLRLKAILLQKMKKCETREFPSSLYSDDLQASEDAIIKYIQKQAFLKEIAILKGSMARKCDNEKKETGIKENRGKVKRSNQGSLTGLDPELHGGILKVGGRLRNACIPSNAKHQVILPKDSHVSNIIIRHIHQLVGHQGRNHVLAEMRQKYWILHASAAVRQMLKRCVICKRYQAKASTQKMADLPSHRLQQDEGAFTRTGVDYFGPFEIKQGRSLNKRYGVIFTCLSSRAVHIEIAYSLDTSSCINALRRFMARRGNVKEFHSDNGSNFVGAKKELQNALKELNRDELNAFASNHGFKWIFNPPAASHFGGVWERQIRTVRKMLHAVLSEQYLKTCQSEEQLHTLMCEVEAIINSRPLTRVSDDVNDLDVITPNSLLLMKPPADIPPGKFIERDLYSRRRWRQMQYLADLFWKRWTREYLPTLQRRQKWLQPKRCMEVGDVVLVVDDQAPRNSWLMGVIIEIYRDKRGLVRSAKIKTKTASFVRPVTKLCLLLEEELA